MFVSIIELEFGWDTHDISVEFELRWDSVSEMGADIFGQPNEGSSISRAPRNATFCKPLYNFSDKFEWFLIVINTIFLPMNYEIVGECSLTNGATFDCGDICGNRC